MMKLAGLGGWELVGGTALIIVLIWIFGGWFIDRVSGRYLGKSYLFKATLKGVFAWILPPWKRALKVFVVVILIAGGLVMIGLAPRWWTYEVTTGYSYRLEEHVKYQPILDYYCRLVTTPIGQSQVCGYVTRWVKTYTYELVEEPVTTHFQVWYLEMGHVLVGVALIIAGLIVASYFMVKANNQLYEVEKPRSRRRRTRKK